MHSVLLRCRDDAFVLPACYVIQRALEVFPWILEA